MEQIAILVLLLFTVLGTWAKIYNVSVSDSFCIIKGIVRNVSDGSDIVLYSMVYKYNGKQNKIKQVRKGKFCIKKEGKDDEKYIFPPLYQAYYIVHSFNRD